LLATNSQTWSCGNSFLVGWSSLLCPAGLTHDEVGSGWWDGSFGGANQRFGCSEAGGLQERSFRTSVCIVSSRIDHCESGRTWCEASAIEYGRSGASEFSHLLFFYSVACNCIGRHSISLPIFGQCRANLCLSVLMLLLVFLPLVSSISI
jgi:hypothetical protein